MKDFGPRIRSVPAPSESSAEEPRDREGEDLDVSDAEAVLEFGLAVERQAAALYDRVLAHVRAKDTRHVRETLEQLLRHMRRLNPGRIRDGGLLSRLLLFGRRRGPAEGFFARYDASGARVEKLIENLEDARAQLLRDLELFERLHDQNLEHLGALDARILVVRRKHDDLTSLTLPGLIRELGDSTDALEDQRARNLEDQIGRLERKIEELRVARTTCLQVAGQIRVFQRGVEGMIESIQTALVNTLPAWRTQIALAVSRTRERRSFEIQGEFAKLAAEVSRKNAEALRRSAAAAPASSSESRVAPAPSPDRSPAV